MHHIPTLAFTQVLNLLVSPSRSFYLTETESGYGLNLADQHRVLKRGRNLRVREDVIEGAMSTLGDLGLDLERVQALATLYASTSEEFETLLSLAHLIRQADLSEHAVVQLVVSDQVNSLGLMLFSHDQQTSLHVATYVVDTQNHQIRWFFGSNHELWSLSYCPTVTRILASAEVDFALQQVGIAHAAIHAAVEQIADDPLLWNWAMRLVDRCAERIDAKAVWQREGRVVRIGIGDDANPAILLTVKATSTCKEEIIDVTFADGGTCKIERDSVSVLSAVVVALLRSQWASVWADVRVGFSDIVCHAMSREAGRALGTGGWISRDCEGFMTVDMAGRRTVVSYLQAEGRDEIWVSEIGGTAITFPPTLRGWQQCFEFIIQGVCRDSA